jgi:hypothetical protein
MTLPYSDWTVAPQFSIAQQVHSIMRRSRSGSVIQLDERTTVATTLMDEIETQMRKAAEDEMILTPRITALLKQLEASGVVIPQPNDVWNYLLRHSDILDLIALTGREARNLFPQPNQLALEIYRDYESGDRSLTLYVRQNQYEKDIMERIDLIRDKLREVRSDWFIPFFLTTDFNFPK